MRPLPAFLVLLLISCGDDPPPPASGASSSSSSSSGSPSTTNDVHELCVAKINEYRATKGLSPYARWTAGETCADGEAKSDGETNTGHGAFPRCSESAQNECPGVPGPPVSAITQCLALMWKQGPGEGHYEMMASTQWREVACGFYTTPNGSVWSVQNFR